MEIDWETTHLDVNLVVGNDRRLMKRESTRRPNQVSECLPTDVLSPSLMTSVTDCQDGDKNHGHEIQDEVTKQSHGNSWSDDDDAQQQLTLDFDSITSRVDVSRHYYQWLHLQKWMNIQGKTLFKTCFTYHSKFSKTSIFHKLLTSSRMSSSSKDTVNLMQLLSTSVAAANHAGFLVRSIMKKGDLGIVDKGVNDLQTEADRSAQRLIVKSITERFPEVTVIGEEGILDDVSSEDIPEISVKELSVQCPEAYTSVASSDIVVWVDPLDGTAEYTQGFLDHVTVLIGIAVSGEAVAIHQY